MNLALRCRTAVAVLLALSAAPAAAQNTYTWDTTTPGTQWLNSDHWTGVNGKFPGVTSNPNANATAAGNAGDIARFTTWMSGTDLGINMADSNNSGVGNNTGANGLLSLGAINFRGKTSNLAIGNSSTTDGVLRLNGATFNPGGGNINNLLIAVADAADFDLTIRNAQDGLGSQRMDLELGITNGVFYVANDRTLTLRSRITEMNTGSGITVMGFGTLRVGADNANTGSLTIDTGRLQILSGTTYTAGGTVQFLGQGFGDTNNPGNARIMVNGAGTLAFGRATTGTADNPDLQVEKVAGASSFGAVIDASVDLGSINRYIKVFSHRNDVNDFRGDLQFNGVISGSGGLIIDITLPQADSGDDIGSVGLFASNTFTGGLTIKRGLVLVGAAGALNSTTPNAVTFDVGANRTGVLYLFGRDATIGDLSSASAGSARIENGATSVNHAPWGGQGDSTLTIRQTGDTTFNGVLADGVVRDNDPTQPDPGETEIRHKLHVVKNGNGHLHLTGNNTYTGTTTINNGTIRVNGQTGNHSGTGTGEVTVNTGGVLGGDGRVAGLVKVHGILAPGNAIGVPGTLTLGGGVTFFADGTLNVQMRGNTAGTYDRLTVTGAVTLGDAKLNPVIGGTYTPGADVLFIIVNNGTDAVSGTFNGLSNGAELTISGRIAHIYYNANFANGNLFGGNDVAIAFSPVPEPGTVLGVAAAALGLGGLARRRLRRATAAA